MTLTHHKLKPKMVIIVDDDSENATILEMLLSMGTNHVSLTYNHPREVFEHLDEIKGNHPALFLIDYRLPEINGLSLCAMLREVDEFTNIPLVMISGFVENSLLREAKQQGIAFIHKPYDVDVLLKVISQLAPSYYS